MNFSSANFVADCFAEQHRRPRFAGPTDVPASALRRLHSMRDAFRHSRGDGYLVKKNTSSVEKKQKKIADFFICLDMERN